MFWTEAPPSLTPMPIRETARGVRIKVSSRTAIQQYDDRETPTRGAPRLRLAQGGAGGSAWGVATRWAEVVADRMLCRSSLVPVTPLLDVRQFEWTRDLRVHWQAVRSECDGVAMTVAAGTHPITAAILSRIPEFHAARFERLPSGAHAAARGCGGRALLTCHLGLHVPRGGDLRMRLGDRVVRWAEGETLLFDATQAQAWWNDSADMGLVLVVEFRRPMQRSGRWLADWLLRRART